MTKAEKLEIRWNTLKSIVADYYELKKRLHADLEEAGVIDNYSKIIFAREHETFDYVLSTIEKLEKNE